MGSKSVRIDKSTFEIMDKLTVKYISHLALISSEVCLQSGKKTISVPHVVEAMQKIGLEKQIKQLWAELDMKTISEEGNEAIDSNMVEMNAKLNKKKKKVKDKNKKKIEMTEEMIREQQELFEQSKKDQLIQWEMEKAARSGNMNVFSRKEEEEDEEEYD